jgi:hypothetical protein
LEKCENQENLIQSIESEKTNLLTTLNEIEIKLKEAISSKSAIESELTTLMTSISQLTLPEINERQQVIENLNQKIEKLTSENQELSEKMNNLIS